jgi:DNA-binding NarL/FixJ family response regulator
MEETRRTLTESSTRPSATAILVVDDEPGILMVLKKRLASWGYRVSTAANGRRAIEVLHDSPPDVLITDLFMPEMNGFELMRHVRGETPDLPLIVMSGQGELRDVIQALRLGAWDYIYKPVEEMSFLRLAIARVLEKARLIKENQAYRDHLEELVAQKSEALVAQQQALLEKTVGLEKANAALKALLDQREIEKTAVEQAMVSNLKHFVFPYLEELERRPSGIGVKAYADIIRTNIEQLISPVSHNLSSAYRNLTPTEVKVADLIRQGQSTKSIAAALNTSPSTIEKHRHSIRRKLEILNKKTNLQTYLNTLR